MTLHDLSLLISFFGNLRRTLVSYADVTWSVSPYRQLMIIKPLYIHKHNFDPLKFFTNCSNPLLPPSPLCCPNSSTSLFNKLISLFLKIHGWTNVIKFSFNICWFMSSYWYISHVLTLKSSLFDSQDSHIFPCPYFSHFENLYITQIICAYNAHGHNT